MFSLFFSLYNISILQFLLLSKWKKRQYAPLKYQNLFPLVYGIKYQKHKIFDIFYLEGGGEEEGLGYLI